MRRRNRFKSFQENFTKFRETNHEDELNSRKFMLIPNIADYVSGAFGYNIPIANADFSQIKWNFTGLPLIMNIFIYPLIGVEVFKQLRRDIYGALAFIPVLMGATTTLILRLRTFYVEDELREIHAHIFKLWDNELRNGIDDEVVENARAHLAFSKSYVIAVVGALILYLVRPFRALFVYYFLDGNVPFIRTQVIPVAYPFVIDTVWKWLLCTIWETIASTYTAMTVISTDLSFIHTCAMLSLQVQALGDKMKNVVRRSDIRSNDYRLIKRLHVLAEEHCHAIKLCRRLQDAYNPAMLTLLITSSISLCSCAIGIEKELSRNDYGAAARFLLHFAAYFTQTFAYCNATGNVCYWMGTISKTIYGSQWFGHSIRFQKRIALIMLRSNMAFPFTAYGFYDVNRVQLKKIIILAYNLLMGIRNMRSLKAL